jgi:hypothetical protein
MSKETSMFRSGMVGFKTITNRKSESHFFHFICGLLTEAWAEEIKSGE